MNLYSFKNFSPKFDDSNYISENATLIGNVTLQKDANIWFNCVARGDVNQIKIGAGTNIQDLSMLHVTEQSDLIIGAGVSVGHSVILHGCEVGDYTLVGMGSTLLDDAVIGEYSLVAAGSLVTPRKKFPPRSLIQGSPAKAVRELTAEEIHFVSNHFKSYIGYSRQFQSEDVKRLS